MRESVNRQRTVLVAFIIFIPTAVAGQEMEPIGDDEFVLVPAGTFTMGSPVDEPGRDSGEVEHEVTISRDFYLQRFEVTLAQWFEVMGTIPEFASCDTCPVRVNLYQTIAFANALSRARGLMECYDVSDLRGEHVFWRFRGPSCPGYRLPTEAEWEYAARAGTTTAYYCGSDPTCIDNVGWYVTNSSRDEQPVGSLEPNEWGLYDMLGNAGEWTSDGRGDYADHTANDPVGLLIAARKCASSLGRHVPLFDAV